MKRLLAYGLLLGTIILLVGTASENPPLRTGKDRALFFAVSNYEHSGLTDLPQPVENAQSIAGVLEERYDFTTEIVTDPSLQQITTKLLEYQNNYATGVSGFDTNGQLMIFFGGHGIKEYGAGYFLPADANPDLVIGTGLAYNNWRGFIDNINCRHILVAIDACYSVTFDPNWQNMGDGDSDRFRRKGELSESERLLAAHNDHPARLFFTSDAQEDVVPGRSNFARKLLEGLSEYRANQPYLTAEELFASYVKRAQPTPNAGDFGRDDPRSSFLFFPKALLNIGDVRADRTAYQAAVQTNTLEAYRQYLRDYPSGDFRSLVQPKVDALEAEERELLAWSRAKQQNTRTAYTSFIQEYPSSIYVPVAEENKRSLADTSPPSQGGAGGGSPDNFIRIPAGTFQMGDQFGDGGSDEKPVHTVELATFYLSPTEVTFTEYDAFCMAIGREKPDDEDWGRSQRPAINVSWCDAVEYANWRSEQSGLQKVYSGDCDNITANWSAKGYRLPTEAEWEYAARQGGQKVRFGNGKDVADSEALNFDGSVNQKEAYSVAGTYRLKTVPVGSLNSPNSLGLHDMSGNVWEWCWDWYGTGYYENSPRSNPKGPNSGSARVLRGGSWGNRARYCRAAFCGRNDRTFRYNRSGFRLARSF